MIIDANKLIVGRLATVAAKKALLGEVITIINCQNAVITGKREAVFAHYNNKKNRGTFKGPFLPRRADLFVKRVIRGMLPYKIEKGSLALKRIKCFVGNPDANGKAETIASADVSKMDNLHYVTVQDICKNLGGKI